MKKLLFVILSLCMAITAFSSGSEDYEFEYNENITIVFENDTVFSQEERQNIADIIVYGNVDNNISTYSLCWLTGHDMISDSVVEIQHKVATTEPRCRRTVYEVETCSNCDHVEITNLGSTFIFCCLEESET